MKARNENPVIVAGGGIGGLAAALALARKGFRSIVLEQAPQFGEIGAGIQLAPNAWHALDALFARRFANPYAVTHRADIHGSLLDGCKALPELIDLRTSSRVVGFSDDGGSVSVEL